MYKDFEDCGYIYPNTTKVKHIYDYIYDCDNVIKSVEDSQKRKRRSRTVIKFNESYLANMDNIYWLLRDEKYVPGKYTHKVIYEPKERVLSIPPYNPDRIIDHCVVNVLEPIWTKVFIKNSFSCIKGRGIHGCMNAVKSDMSKDYIGTKFALKIDIKKFYDNIDHDVLKKIIRYKISDNKVLRLLDIIIDSNGQRCGLPIGRYTSQYLANLYLSYFDHYCLENLKCKYYYRYMDDIVVLSGNKSFLHNLLSQMGLYLSGELHLEIKSNWQIFPVDKRDLDFVGYRQNHYSIRMRNSILMRFYRKYNRTKTRYVINNESDFMHSYPSEYGWIISCSEKHSKVLINKCLTK